MMRRMSVPRCLGWLGAGVLVVLCARSLAYALSTDPLSSTLEHQAGGPRLPVLSLIALGLALAVSSAIVWLAALGVQERRLLEAAPLIQPPRLRLGRAGLRAVLLFAATSVAFALLESTIHLRSGLGWHGLHCLVGPTHRNALPILAALSLVAAAVSAALELVFAWMRRTVARIRTPRLRLASLAERVSAPAPARPPRRGFASTLGARGPPVAIA